MHPAIMDISHRLREVMFDDRYTNRIEKIKLSNYAS